MESEESTFHTTYSVYLLIIMIMTVIQGIYYTLTIHNNC